MNLNIGKIFKFLTLRRKREAWHFTDFLTYLYLFFGVFLMFGPAVWLVLSSFKTEAGLMEFPPTFLPLSQIEVNVPGYKKKLPLYNVEMDDGSVRQLAQIRRIGIIAQMVDPAQPKEKIKVNIDKRLPIKEMKIATENYTWPLQHHNFFKYFFNSVVVTVAATAITLLINSMAAYALAIYEFPGRTIALGFVIGTLLIPISVILVPVYLVVTQLGMVNSLWSVILPGAATPTGVFLLRQYMLTIPTELIEAARMDRASEWQIYWRIVAPLALPAIAVLAIFSIMWRWNEFLWPLVVLTRNEVYTLQIGLHLFEGELRVGWHYVLAMTVLALLPVVIVFGWLQKFITTGIASTGIK